MRVLEADDFFALPVEKQLAWQNFIAEYGADARDVFRIEVGDGRITLHRYARNGEGTFYYDPTRDHAALAPPLVLLDVEPPA